MVGLACDGSDPHPVRPSRHKAAPPVAPLPIDPCGDRPFKVRKIKEMCNADAHIFHNMI